MPNAIAISRFIQARLTQLNRSSVTAVEAAGWMDAEKLLRDSRTRPGKPLRDLLRAGQITGQRQDSNQRWFIDQVVGHDTSISGTRSQTPASLHASDARSSAGAPYRAGKVLPDILAEGLRVVFICTVVGDESARRQHDYLATHARQVRAAPYAMTPGVSGVRPVRCAYHQTF